MSRISKQIRAYVDDPESTGRLHYGEWGSLRPDQRRLIRKLCDECDAFERDADHIAEQYEAKLREKDAEIERLEEQCNNYENAIDEGKEKCSRCSSSYHALIDKAYNKALTEFADRIIRFYNALPGKTVGGSVEYHVKQVRDAMLKEAEK